ncbi:MAG: protein-ADP-ribose hydrolase [Atopobiaceae bacterium]
MSDTQPNVPQPSEQRPDSAIAGDTATSNGAVDNNAVNPTVDPTIDPATMSQEDRRRYLIDYLKSERPEYAGIVVPDDPHQQQSALRALLNVRTPRQTTPDFLAVQDAYLQERARQRGIVNLDQLHPSPLDPELYLWQGDITRMATDAIVNSANDQMMGCYEPLHVCVDNAVHTFAGIQLREVCFAFMQEQGHAEPTGHAKITYGFNLPARYIIHTVGPNVSGSPSKADADTLASCYRSCLALAQAHDLKSIAFCSISTGESHFPAADAARIAVSAVRDFKKDSDSHIRVVFDVFSEEQRRIYQQLLS